MNPHAAVVGEGPTGQGTLLLVPGKNLRTGENDFSSQYPDITSLESDLLRVASAIYACDLAFKRGEREEIVRSIEVTIPVVNHQAFKSIRDDLELALWIVSDDNWTVKFSRADGAPEPARKWPNASGKTILFSGGVDSFAGALDLIAKGGVDTVHLASHFTANPITRQSQRDLYDYISRNMGKPEWTAVRSGGRKVAEFYFPSDNEREETQRTRSFTFLAIAALAARRSGHHNLVVIAENGQMAIHLPISVARIGAFSTQTAHPEFVRRIANIFSTILDTPLTLENPFLYLTKAEVVASISTEHRTVLHKAVSCWRSSRVSDVHHCGECVPCLVRRIAFEHNGLKFPEYDRDLLAETIADLPDLDEGKRNLVDLAEFAQTFKSEPEGSLEEIYPALINEDINITDAISMYKRFADEAWQVLSQYSGPAALLTPAKSKKGA